MCCYCSILYLDLSLEIIIMSKSENNQERRNWQRRKPKSSEQNRNVDLDTTISELFGQLNDVKMRKVDHKQYF